MTSSAHAEDFYFGTLTEMTNAFHANDVRGTSMGTGGTLVLRHTARTCSDVLNMGDHRLPLRRLGKRSTRSRLAH